MAHRYLELAMTPAAKRLQEIDGSREAYARSEGGEEAYHFLGEREASFIAQRDSFYIASVSETGWPYIQHRGGPRGFLRVLDEETLGFLDFRGNRQFLTAGNLLGESRVALFLVDYPGRRRLKLLGRARMRPVAEDPACAEALALPGYMAVAERITTITVEAFDWNCPQHITPRFTETEIAETVTPLHARIAELEAALAGQSTLDHPHPERKPTE